MNEGAYRGLAVSQVLEGGGEGQLAPDIDGHLGGVQAATEGGGNGRRGG